MAVVACVCVLRLLPLAFRRAVVVAVVVVFVVLVVAVVDVAAPAATTPGRRVDFGPPPPRLRFPPAAETTERKDAIADGKKEVSDEGEAGDGAAVRDDTPPPFPLLLALLSWGVALAEPLAAIEGACLASGGFPLYETLLSRIPPTAAAVGIGMMRRRRVAWAAAMGTAV